MFTQFTDWFLGRPSRPNSDTCKSELNRLEHLHNLHVEHDHDWLNAHDPIDKAHNKHSIRHGRRVEHHARAFWYGVDDHPESVLKDEHIPQITPMVTDREMAREHCIHPSDLLTWHDCMEEPGSGVQTHHAAEASCDSGV